MKKNNDIYNGNYGIDFTKEEILDGKKVLKDEYISDELPFKPMSGYVKKGTKWIKVGEGCGGNTTDNDSDDNLFV